MGVKCNYFNTPRSKIFHSSKFYWYQKKSVYKIWNSPIQISEFYSLREIGMEFKCSNLFYFRKANAVRVYFLHTIKRYLSISFCFLKLCCINASRLLLFCVFIDGDFWGVNTYSTLPPPPLVPSEVQVHGMFSLYKHLVCQSVLCITSHPRLPAAFIGYPLPPAGYK